MRVVDGRDAGPAALGRAFDALARDHGMRSGVGDRLFLPVNIWPAEVEQFAPAGSGVGGGLEERSQPVGCCGVEEGPNLARGWCLPGLQVGQRQGVASLCHDSDIDPRFASVPNPVQHRDARVLIGILAILEGEIWGLADSTGKSAGEVAERSSRSRACWLVTPLSVGPARALGVFNQRLRYAAG